jgi:hypothetical protein
MRDGQPKIAVKVILALDMIRLGVNSRGRGIV